MQMEEKRKENEKMSRKRKQGNIGKLLVVLAVLGLQQLKGLQKCAGIMFFPKSKLVFTVFSYVCKSKQHREDFSLHNNPLQSSAAPAYFNMSLIYQQSKLR